MGFNWATATFCDDVNITVVPGAPAGRSSTGTALVLTEKAGKVTGGKYYLLVPEHPRDLSKGKGYSLNNLTQEEKTVKGDVSVVDGSSTTGTKDMRLTITLKESFEGDRVRAEVQEGNGEKRPIVFVREN